MASHIEGTLAVNDLLSIPSHQYLFLPDIKHGYWAININLNNWHYLAFHIPRIGQVQPTRMSQGARTSFFIFNELMNIVFGSIPPS